MVERDVPPGKESGKHTQSGNEIVYIQEGSVILEVQGKPAKTLKAGEAFTAVAGEVHNVKNASSSESVKAIDEYSLEPTATGTRFWQGRIKAS